MTKEYRRLSAIDYPGLWEELRSWATNRRSVPLRTWEFHEFMTQHWTLPIETHPGDVMGDFWIREKDFVLFVLRWS